jgi:transglutaminase-like putative cysteine protease
MQSASPNPGFHLELVPGRLWGRTRASLTGAVAWSAVLVLLLTLMIARSTATAAWVSGIDVVTAVALSGAVLMGVLAVTPVPWPAGLGIGLVAGPVVAALAAGPALHAAHPLDTVSISTLSAWWTRVADGAASSDAAFYLYLICLLMWVTGGWLSWCVLRWRRPMLGLVPGAAAFSTNLLNNPTDQNGFTLAILVLTLGLLLWTNYTASIASATRARVKLTGDARWDFWESGLVAMAALIVLGIMLPPLSTVDQTVDMQSSIFSRWAQLQEQLSHGTVFGHGSTGGGTTGFSTDVALNGPLKRTHNIVFTYTFTSSSGPRYFRGVNETLTLGGEWRYQITVQQERIAKDTVPVYAEDYQKLALTGYNVKMVSPPIGNTDILFYPGTLFRTDRESLASQVVLPFDPLLTTIDRLSSVAPPVSTGSYNITTEYSTATEADLKQAGTAYADWLASYRSLPTTGYRTAQDLASIHKLAVQVTTAAGAVTPYDKAKAIEAYLRDSRNYTYRLDPPATPDGVDPLAYFLFTSKQGYCEFFASAMGDMLRSLGIPTRLVNGFGPGTYDTTINSWVVRGEDAHTWVETYFPTYGWITFEPTPDGVYTPIQRGSSGTNVCLRDNQCTAPGGSGSTGPVGPVTRPESGGPNVEQNAPPSIGSAFSLRSLDAATLTKIVGVLLALLLLAFVAAARYLRPRTVMAVWKRTLVLARLAGAERRAGETPLELGRRLAYTFPEASEPVRSLADGFVVSAYAPPDLAGSARASVMDAWAALRPMLLRRVASRLRPNRA